MWFLPAAASQSFEVLESARNDAHTVESERCPHIVVSATAPHTAAVSATAPYTVGSATAPCTVDSATEPHIAVSATVPHIAVSVTAPHTVESETSPRVLQTDPEVPQGEANPAATISTLPLPHLVSLDCHSSHPLASLDDAFSHGTVLQPCTVAYHAEARSTYGYVYSLYNFVSVHSVVEYAADSLVDLP